MWKLEISSKASPVRHPPVSIDMVDTHTHIYLPEFSIEGQPEGSMEGQSATLRRALAAGVDSLVFPNVDRSTIGPMMELHRLFPENTYVAMGLHPTEVRENWRDELDYFLDLLRTNSDEYVAVGEVGIDLYWDRTFEKEQMTVFEEQVHASCELGLPLLIHCREGLDRVLEVMEAYPAARAVFHSFGGTVDDVERIRRHGDHFFGINGIVTFKNSRLASVLPAIGLDRILTETDSPYLAPVPHRGQRNESAYIPLIVDRIAQALDRSVPVVAAATSQNALNFLNIH